ncbi:MAG: 4'-phosphopantetheinyl transferase superfamily protein [Solirubrobacterales bacterium]
MAAVEIYGTSPAEPPREVEVLRVELNGDDRRGAHEALAEVLAARLGSTAAAATVRTEAGKPRLAEDPPRLSFNLSHSGGLALIAIAPGGVEVGVDVERLRPRRDLVRLAERWLPEDDAGAVAAAAPGAREAVFYAAWTRHEARVKCLGTGLAGPPPGPEVVAVQLKADDGYAAAVAVHDPAAPGLEPRVVLRDGPGRR